MIHGEGRLIFLENGQMTGLDIELTEEIFKRVGMDYQIKLYPWARLIKDVEEGKVAGIIATFCNLEVYTNILEYSSYTYPSSVSVFARRDKNFVMSQLGDLAGLTVGVLRSYTYAQTFNEMTTFTRDQSRDDEMLLRKLANDRVDVAVAETAPFEFYAKQFGFENDFESVYVIQSTNVCMAFAKNTAHINHAELLPKVNEAIAQMHEEGAIERIVRKYK